MKETQFIKQKQVTTMRLKSYPPNLKYSKLNIKPQKINCKMIIKFSKDPKQTPVLVKSFEFSLNEASEKIRMVRVAPFFMTAKHCGIAGTGS